MTHTVNLTGAQVEALRTVFEYASEARADFWYRVEKGDDYTPEDIQDAEDRFAAQLDVEASIMSQLDRDPEAILAKAAELRKAWKKAWTAWQEEWDAWQDGDAPQHKEQRAWDELVDYVEKHDLVGTSYDPRESEGL